MNEKEFQKELERRQKLRHIESLDANENRAQGVTIGRSGNGSVELTMRTHSGKFLWYCMQPVEAVETIHQLAASIGCHIHIQPREDFSSYRVWKEPTEAERKHLNGFAPFPNMLTNSQDLGRIPKEIVEEGSQEKEHVATKKAVNKRSTKRRRATAK